MNHAEAAAGGELRAPIRRVAFIGLGAMGLPMARRISAAGFEVVGYHPRRERARQLTEAGIPVTISLRQAVVRADLVATMLPGPDEVQEVMGADGAMSFASPGTVVVDFSTVGPAVAVALSRMGASSGIPVLDAPVTGGVQGAAEGTLVAMVGGSRAVLETARPVLTAVAQRVEWVGASGAGQVVKAANQLIVGGALGVLAEAIALLQAHRIDLAPALGVLGAGQASSAILQRKVPRILVGDFSPQFRLELMAKDLNLVRSAAAGVGVALPLADLCARLFETAADAGYGELDCSAVVRQVAEGVRAVEGDPGR